MVDYNGMKVPELKKVLQERGLPLTGNKADLIARLQEDDKQKAPEAAEPKADNKPVAAEDEIDYDDDDFPPIKNGSAEEAKKADAPAAQDKPEDKTEDAPAAETKVDETAPAATAEGDKPAEKTEEAAPAAPLFTANLAATNAQTEAEKRAARAARFGIVLDEDSEEAKASARAAKFGVANDQISALDSALPERGPRKRGRDAKDDGSKPKTADGEQRANKRQQQQQPSNSARNANTNRNQQQRGGRRGGPGGGRNNQQQRHGNAQKASGGGGGGAAAKPPQRQEDPADKAKKEARAKRFA